MPHIILVNTSQSLWHIVHTAYWVRYNFVTILKYLGNLCTVTCIIIYSDMHAFCTCPQSCNWSKMLLSIDSSKLCHDTESSGVWNDLWYRLDDSLSSFLEHHNPHKIPVLKVIEKELLPGHQNWMELIVVIIQYVMTWLQKVPGWFAKYHLQKYIKINYRGMHTQAYITHDIWIQLKLGICGHSDSRLFMWYEYVLVSTPRFTLIGYVRIMWIRFWCWSM